MLTYHIRMHVHHKTNLYLGLRQDCSKKANSIILDLGYVGEAAEVKLNGQTVDTHPTLQYLFDLTDFAKEDNNSLSIIISNQLGYNHRDPFYSYLVFEPSVLMGPVKILTYQKESEAEK